MKQAVQLVIELLVVATTLNNSIRDIPVSNLGLDTDYTLWDFSLLFRFQFVIQQSPYHLKLYNVMYRQRRNVSHKIPCPILAQ